jgi:hypothetical protein
MRVLLASFEGMDPSMGDDEAVLQRLAERGISAAVRPWTDTSIDWDEADLVVVRTTWDYTFRHADFLAWVQGRTAPVANDPALIGWNSDKRYLADLAAAGIPTVTSTFVAPGDPVPLLRGEVVVKPTVSAGGRDTGRFGPAATSHARDLVGRITASGRTAMVQPFVPSVDEVGETAIVVIDGVVSHVLRKLSVLRPDEVAPLRNDALGAAEAMYDPDLVQAGVADDRQYRLAEQVLSLVRQRFGSTPLHLRVDMLTGADGHPLLLELEAVEPHLYVAESDGAADRLAAAIERRARTRPGRDEA